MANTQQNLQSPIVGPSTVGDGTNARQLRAERTGALVIQHAHGEYYEEVARGNVWTISTVIGGVSPVTAVGCITTAANNPIVGLYNQATNINCHITRAIIVVVTGTMVTGGFVWGTSTSPTGITSAGVSARNNRTFIKGGHQAAAFDGSAALTGQTSASNVQRYFGGAVAGATSTGANLTFEESEDDIVVAPGCYAGLYATVLATGLNVVASLTWAEIPT